MYIGFEQSSPSLIYCDVFGLLWLGILEHLLGPRDITTGYLLIGLAPTKTLAELVNKLVKERFRIFPLGYTHQ